MPRNFGLRIGLVVAVLAVSLWYLYPPKQRINLGLDLQGGIHLVLGVEADKHMSSQTERAAEDLKNGLERKGVGVMVNWRFADGAHFLPPFEEVRAMRKD